MKIALQKLNADDYPLFLKWWRDKELIDLTSGDHTPMTNEVIKKQVWEMASDTNTHHWLIVIVDKPVGHINLNKIDDEAAELQIVIGEKEYWGKGIGTQAIADVSAQAKSLGYKRIVVEARPENTRAIHLYEKMGFVKQGLKKYPGNPNQLEVVVLEKRI